MVINSDITGIADSLSPYLGRDIKNAIVLGTGGSSRSVCYVLKKFGWNITRCPEIKDRVLLIIPILTRRILLRCQPDYKYNTSRNVS